jgi:hypothetical protein
MERARGRREGRRDSDRSDDSEQAGVRMSEKLQLVDAGLVSVYRRVLGGRAPLEKSLPFRHRANLVATSKCDDNTRTVQLFLL